MYGKIYAPKTLSAWTRSSISNSAQNVNSLFQCVCVMMNGVYQKEVEMAGNPKEELRHGHKAKCEGCGERFKRFTYGQKLCEDCRRTVYPHLYKYYGRSK